MRETLRKRDKRFCRVAEFNKRKPVNGPALLTVGWLAGMHIYNPITIGRKAFVLFFRQKGCSLCQPADQSALNYFAFAWAAVENILLAATAEGLVCAFRIPIGNEPEHVKQTMGAPEGYEFTCFLAIGYPAENAPLCRQKEINIVDRIHCNVW